jgi:RNA polymerase sigma factor (sigma-70 family)
MSALPLEAFRDSYRELIAFVARRTGSRQSAQDIVHDAWLRVVEAGPAAQTSHPAPRAYLYTVAEHLVVDHLRRAARTTERFDSAFHDSSAGMQAMGQDVAEACLQREALVAVDAAIAALPERCRSMFLADRLDGESQMAIAAAHGVSVKTVEREIMRAMDAIEAALHEWRGDGVVQTLPRKGRRRALSALLGVAGLGASGSLAWRLYQSQVVTWQMQLGTATGRQLTQPLPDGGSITLDAQTRLDVRYYGTRRYVQMHHGAAFFKVARNADAPFIVDAGPARITVLGTRFEVALDAQGGVRVAVEEGRVRVQNRGSDGDVGDAGEGWELTDRQTLDWQLGQTPRRDSSPDEVAAWRNGWLDFRHEPLGLAVQRLARYGQLPMQVAPDAEHLTIFGRVRIADARGWLQLLPRSLPVVVREEGQGAARRITIARRKAQS